MAKLKLTYTFLDFVDCTIAQTAIKSNAPPLFSGMHCTGSNTLFQISTLILIESACFYFFAPQEPHKIRLCWILTKIKNSTVLCEITIFHE